MIWTALVLGLMSSLHCIGMCGPLLLALPMPTNNVGIKIIHTLSYHVARIFTYFIFGLILGSIGWSANLIISQQWLSVAVGIFMIVIVVFPNMVTKLNEKSKIFSFQNQIKNHLLKQFKSPNIFKYLVLGFLNGMLPCGMVYMALAGSMIMVKPIDGALYMSLFGLGTIPTLFTFTIAYQLFPQLIKVKINKFIPYLTVFIAILLILRGLNLGIPFVSPELSNGVGNVQCH